METLDEFMVSCLRCDRERYLIQAERELTRAIICPECFETCPACDGHEYTYFIDAKGYEVARRCSICGALKRRIQAFNEARIPRRHSAATLQNFETHLIRPDGSRAEAVGNLNRVRFRLYNWVKGFAPGERGFLLHGPVGTGKTHLLAGAIRHLTLEKGIPARFVEFTHLLSDIKEQFDQGRGESAVLAPLIDVPVLAIDELGKGRNTDWQLSIIDEIISKRYNRSLTTLFTTNYPVEAVAAPAGDADSIDFRRQAAMSHLSERVGERVFSRLFDMAEFIAIDAPDYRRRLAGQL